jgi:hypothetical protein
MKKIIISALFIASMATSCKKDDAGTPAISKFITTTPGTTWNYQTTDNSTSEVSTYTRISSSRDTTINSKLYHIFNNTDINGTTEAYYNNTGNDYYQFSTLAAGLDPIDLHYLNDAKTVGETWNQSFSVPVTLPNFPTAVPITVRINYSVVEKGISLVVNDTTYNNVIKVKSDITIDPILTFTFSTTSNIYNYYAPKYGLIRSDFNLVASFSGAQVINTNTTDLLMRSSIQ